MIICNGVALLLGFKFANQDKSCVLYIPGLTFVPRMVKDANKKAAIFLDNCLIFKWCHQESNRGHKDFQSFALPTELWHRLVCECKGMAKFSIAQINQQKSSKISLFCFFVLSSHHKQWRNVAQLVAHYVRDVGVGRSSRLIPTQGDKRAFSVVAFSFSLL